MSMLINIIFLFENRGIALQANLDELFAEVAFRYLKKTNSNKEDFKFIFNSIELKPESGKTLGEYNLRDMSRIQVISMSHYNYKEEDDVGSIIIITFKKKENSIKIQMQTYSKKIFGNLVKRFINLTQYNKKFHFYFNNSELIDYNKTLSDYEIKDNSIIEVEECEHSKSCSFIPKLEKEKEELIEQLNKEKNKIEELKKENNNLKQKLENYNLKNTKKSEYLVKSINQGDKILAVNFVSIGNKDIEHYNLICKNSDLFISLEERLYKDFPKFKEYNTLFKVNDKTIKRFKTIDENNIHNNDVISIYLNED